jgi:hypothetical protein
MSLRSPLRFVPFVLLLGACAGDEAAPPAEASQPPPADAPAAAEPADTGRGGLADAAKSAVEGVSSDAADYVSQAETLLAEVQEFLAASNLEKAKLSLGKLEALEDKLPASWGPTIEKVRSAAQALEAKSDLKVPGLDGLKLPGGG